MTYTARRSTPCTVQVTGAGGLNLTPPADYTNNTERRHGHRQLHLRGRRQPHRQQRHGDLHHRPGRLDHDRDLARRAVHLYRLAADALHRLSHRRRRPEPDADGRLRQQHRRRAPPPPATPTRATPTTPAAATAKTFTIDKAASTTTVTLPGGPFTYTGTAADARHRDGDRRRRPEPDAAGRLHQQHQCRDGDRQLHLSRATPTTPAAATAKTFTIDKAASTTTVTIAGGPIHLLHGSPQTPVHRVR